MDSQLDWHAARAALDWQVELGVTEAISEMPVDRFEAARAAAAERAAAPAPAASQAAGTPVTPPEVDPVAEAREAAARAGDLAALRAALGDYPHCDLRLGARNLVFADGDPAARVMVIGEAPGRDEDLEGRPFVGRAGQLLDRMFEAIGLARTAAGRDALYITNVVPWRPPGNRDPLPAEVSMMVPFLERHVALADPEIVVVMGNVPLGAVLARERITRVRGQWGTAWGRPVMPMCHPAYLLRRPEAKREAWADLLDISARLEGAS